MGKIIIGSARIDERGKVSGGALGDNNGKEVSMQEFYISSKGWNVFRAKDASTRQKLAYAMEKYCNDDNVGYDQSNRLSILKYNGKVKTECDCSSLVRRCIIDSTGIDVGNFTTGTEKKVLEKSGLFDFIGKYDNTVKLFTGDIICTCTRGHTCIIVSVPASVTAQYQVGCTYQTTGSLYCRVLPDKTSKAICVYTAGTRLTVKDVKVIDGNIWVKTNKGWCAGVYDKKVRIK